MNLERRTVDTLKIPLGGNRLLPVGLYRTPDGQPHTLHLALGWANHNPRRPGTPNACLIVSADAMRPLRAA